MIYRLRISNLKFLFLTEIFWRKIIGIFQKHTGFKTSFSCNANQNSFVR